MTVQQEDALYDFLDTAITAFTGLDAAAAVRRAVGNSPRRLQEDIEAFIRTRRLAFPAEDGKHWLSRRGFFADGVFAIQPTRLEIRNGILIPGHRCLPFANPILLPHELTFVWQAIEIPSTSSEGPPEEYYSYYDLYGEEYSPQYVAKENPTNEEAFNADPYEDPPEVSIRVLDMRTIFRECAFIPGDHFEVRTLDWPGGRFELRHAPKTAWSSHALAEWKELAEEAFFKSFDHLGPGASTEEQIAFAYWFGGERLKRTPAYSMEDFLYNITERIESTAFGMETRFWRTGKDIPDTGPWMEDAGPPDKTELELLLAGLGLPISEYVVEAYVRDAFFRKATEIHDILERLLPESVQISRAERLHIAQFVSETREDFKESYNYFSDKDMGPLRQRAAELHTAIIDLTLRLSAEDLNSSWLPKQAFVTLAQLQAHAATLLEDLDFDETPEQRELMSMDNSLDAMIDTFDEIKEAIDLARDGFRRSRLSLIHPNAVRPTDGVWRALQASVAGTSVWRRLSVPDWITLRDLHRCIQTLLGWSDSRLHGFIVDGKAYGATDREGEAAEQDITVGEIAEREIREFVYDYDYGAEWEVKLNLLNPTEPEADNVPRCLCGEGAAPPESIGGPLRFRRFLSALKGADGPEKLLAAAELGSDYAPEAFDIDAANRALTALFGGAET